EALRTFVVAASRGNREGGRGGNARADPPESEVRGPDDDPGGCEKDLRERPSGRGLPRSGRRVSGLRPGVRSRLRGMLSSDNDNAEPTPISFAWPSPIG